ncbi:MAG: pyridoxal phosphate-dependent aminotransferase [Helicobacteraceae bacterium]|jgi:aspartate aminotransferase|nr:pyridoxal phosphate-dependent aminotransferase [Helicobacteraceae bacterium]
MHQFLSERIQIMEESLTLAMTQKARELKAAGRETLSFSAGEPDFDVPQAVKDAAIAAIKSGANKYTNVSGTDELREAIAAKLKRENHIGYAPKNIVVSSGAKHSLFQLFAVLLNHGDEVIIPTPAWVSYPEMARYHGAKDVLVRTKAENDFKMTPDELRAAISPRAKLVVICSPSNPTGSVYSAEEIAAFGEILRGTNAFVVSDEIYEKLVYGVKFISTAAVSDLFDRTITVNGLSKCAAMTGWRLGYLATANAEIAKAVTKLQSQSTTNASSIVQKAAIAALDGRADADMEAMRKRFEARRDLALSLFEKLDPLKTLKVVKPQGAFYLFVSHEAVEKDSMKFCLDLLEKTGVATVPGVGFEQEGYFRMSFATDEKSIEKGIHLIADFVKNY